MYKINRKFYIFLSIILAVLTLTGCSKVTMDMKDVKGEWTVSTLSYEKTEQTGTVDIMVNDPSSDIYSMSEFTPDEFAVMMGKKEIIFARNYNITESKLTRTLYDSSRKDTVTNEYDIEAKSNGFYALDGDEIKGSFIYNKDQDIIKVTEDLEGRNVVFTLKRGNTDILGLSDKESDKKDGEKKDKKKDNKKDD